MAEHLKSPVDPRVSAAYAGLTPAQRAQLSVALARRAAHGTDVIHPIDRSGAETFPPSYGQERLWFLDQLRPGSAAYTVPVALRLTGTLDQVALDRAVQALVARHEGLRTTFPAPGGRPMQRISARISVPLALIDVSDLTGSRRAARIDAACRHEAALPFDLAIGPLVRATLIRTGATEHILLLSLHHIVADGWSVALLVGELAALYRGDVLPAPELDYVDFAGWQRDRLSGGVLEEEVAYWRRNLRAAMPLMLPTDRPRGSSGGGGAHPVAWSPEFVAEIRQLARGANATLFMAVLAGITATLSRWAEQDDLVIGTPVGGRDNAAWESVVGFFANTVPLRINLAGDPSFRDLLARTRQVSLDGLAHQRVPYEKIVEAVRPDRADAPLVAAMLALRNVPTTSPAMDGISIELLPAPVIEAKFDLTWELADDGAGGLVGRLEYAANLFDADTAERLHACVTELLRAACRTPDEPVSRLPLISVGARRELADGVEADPALLATLEGVNGIGAQRFHVLDPTREPVPLGAAGALFVGPPATATAALQPTGHRARRCADGRIELLPALVRVDARVDKPVARTMVPPADALERLLAGVWADVLEVEQVGVLDDFFELGGHSLLVTQAVSRIQTALALPVPLDGALTATSIREFAGYLRELGAAAAVDVDAAAERGTVQAGTVQAGTVQAGTVQAGTVQAGTVQAGTVEPTPLIPGPRRLDRDAFRRKPPSTAPIGELAHGR